MSSCVTTCTRNVPVLLRRLPNIASDFGSSAELVLVSTSMGDRQEKDQKSPDPSDLQMKLGEHLAFKPWRESHLPPVGPLVFIQHKAASAVPCYEVFFFHFGKQLPNFSLHSES